MGIRLASEHEVDLLRQPWWMWEEKPLAILSDEYEGVLVGCVRMFARTLTDGRVDLPACGIGGLYSEKKASAYRLSGYRLMEAAVEYARTELRLLVVVFYSRLRFYDYASDHGYVALKQVGNETLWARSLIEGLVLRRSEEWNLSPSTHF